MVSAVDKAKRALVALIRSLATRYQCRVDITRDSSDLYIGKAYRTLSRKVHPDRGGSEEDQKRLNAANDAWTELCRSRAPNGRPEKETKKADPPQPALPGDPSEDPAKKTFRVRAAAVLLTYQGVQGLPQWHRFVEHVLENLAAWKVRLWTATLETNADGTNHAHLMLQFSTQKERSVQMFFFEGLRPNARPNDLLGEGFSAKRWQQSVDRGHFYVWADKIGTVRDASGQQCLAGNYTPAWTDGAQKYKVFGDWSYRLWQAYKLSDEAYEEYLHLCRDGLAHRKKQLRRFPGFQTRAGPATRSGRKDQKDPQQPGDLREVRGST